MDVSSNRLGRERVWIGRRIGDLVPGGECILGCAIGTEAGVRFADVAWASDEFIRAHGFQTPYEVAPELCVEVVSPSNSSGLIREKIALSLGRGASEVWICGEDGELAFHGASGRLERSGLVPGFPARIG